MMHKKLIDELDSFANLYGQDTLWAQSAAAIRELLKEREEYQQAVTALDESMKPVPVNEQLIKLNIELGSAKLEIRDLRTKLEKAEDNNSRLRKAIEEHRRQASQLASKDADGNPVFTHIDGELYNALEGK